MLSLPAPRQDDKKKKSKKKSDDEGSGSDKGKKHSKKHASKDDGAAAGAGAGDVADSGRRSSVKPTVESGPSDYYGKSGDGVAASDPYPFVLHADKGVMVRDGLVQRPRVALPSRALGLG